MPWQRSVRDANLCTGNLFKSYTDITVTAARGAGLTLNRSYSSNDDRVGPFGVGWTHPYDIRVAEAGNDTAQSTDFFGAKHTYKRDADGLYTPPPYASDMLSSDYDKMAVGGPTKVLEDTDTGSDGSVKHYVSFGDERVCDYMQDRHGNRTTLSYGLTVVLPTGPKRLLTQVQDPSGRTLTLQWTNIGPSDQPAWRVTGVVGPMYRVTYDYYTNPTSPNAANELYNLAAVHIDPDGLNRTTSYTYTGLAGPAGVENGLLHSVTDPLGRVTTYEYEISPYDPLGTAYVSRVVEPGDGGPVTWYMCIRSNSTTDQTVGGAAVYPQIVLLGRAYPDSWGSFPGWSQMADSRGITVGSDNRLRCVDWGGEGISPYPTYFKSYDDQNNVIYAAWAEVDNSGNPTGPTWDFREEHYQYDAVGHRVQRTVDHYPGAETATYYDADRYFQKASETDMNGHTTRYVVGSSSDPNPGNRGEVLAIQDARYSTTGKQFSYSYNQYGQKTVEVNPNGVETDYVYGDGDGNRTHVIQDPGGAGHLNRSSSVTYDAAGHPITVIDACGRTTTTEYNVLGQATDVRIPATPGSLAQEIHADYDANGRPTVVSDARGTTTLTYEPGTDRTASISDPVSGTVSYTYRRSGEILTCTLPGGGTWRYDYDQYGGVVMPKDDPNTVMLLPVRVTDDQGRRVDLTVGWYGYLWSVRSNQAFDAGGGIASYQETCYLPRMQPDGRGMKWQPAQVSTVWHGQGPTGSSVARLLYQSSSAFDAADQRQANTVTQAVTNADGSPVWNADGTAKVSTRTETYGYDELNRLTNVNYGDGEVQSYVFDPMGNRLTKTDNVTGNETYDYDSANMLTSHNGQAYTNDANGNTLIGGGRTTMWDGQNHIVSCQYNGNTSSYVYGADGLRRQATVNGVTTDFVLDSDRAVREMRGGSPVATYLYSPRGPEYRRDDVTGQIRWYVYDGLGSVVGEVAPNGNLTATRAHDAFGCVRTATGTRTSPHGFAGGVGHPSEDATGLIYMRARYMDPSVGRFMSEDPQLASANLFTYCENDPINRVDATGKMSGAFLKEVWTFFHALIEGAEYAVFGMTALGLILGAIGIVLKWCGKEKLGDAFILAGALIGCVMAAIGVVVAVAALIAAIAAGAALLAPIAVAIGALIALICVAIVATQAAMDLGKDWDKDWGGSPPEPEE